MDIGPESERIINNLRRVPAFKAVKAHDPVALATGVRFVLSCEPVNPHANHVAAWELGIYVLSKRAPLKRPALYVDVGVISAQGLPPRWYPNLRELALDSEAGRVDLTASIATGITENCPLHVAADNSWVMLRFQAGSRTYGISLDRNSDEYGKIRRLVRVTTVR